MALCPMWPLHGYLLLLLIFGLAPLNSQVHMSLDWQGLPVSPSPGLYCSQLCKKHLTTGQLSRKEKTGNQSFPTQKTNGLVRNPGTELAHCAGIPVLCTRCAGCRQEALLKHVLVLLSGAVALGGVPCAGAAHAGASQGAWVACW